MGEAQPYCHSSINELLDDPDHSVELGRIIRLEAIETMYGLEQEIHKHVHMHVASVCVMLSLLTAIEATKTVSLALMAGWRYGRISLPL